MNKSKTIYFLSAFVLIIGCYALNLSYSLFIDTQEKSIINASVPKLDSELSLNSVVVEAGKEYLIKQTVTNIGTVAMNYAVNASSDVDTYTVKMAETEDNLSNGTLDINGAKDLYIVVSNTGEETITINFTLDKNYTTLTSKVPISNIVETTTVEYGESFPYGDKPGTLTYQIISNFVNSDLYNPTTATTLSTEDNIVADIPGLFGEGVNKLSIPVPNPDSNTELDVPSPTTFTSTEENEVGLYKAEDDHGMSYYFRGASSVNYVNFAGMCWRIVRIDGNGNIKLILEDQYTTCDDDETSETDTIKYTGAWDIEASDGTNITMDGSIPYRTGNFGYDDSSGKYKMSYLNPVDENDKAMVNSFKYFQTNTLKNKINALHDGKDLSDYLVSGNWCLNDKAYSDEQGTTILENPDYSSEFYYDSYVRLYGKTTKEPTLKCPVETMETFADNTHMYVGTLTADEIVYAGGKVFATNTNYYLINNWQNSNTKKFWSLSPSYFGVSNDLAFSVYSSGRLYDDFMRDDIAFRPSVSLTSSVTVLPNGNGDITNPYFIQ